MGKLFSRSYNRMKMGQKMRILYVFLLLGTLLHSVESESEALFLRRIADFWEEGEYQIAKSQIEEFIVQYPESAFTDPLSAALGDLQLREKNYANAMNYYARIQTPEWKERVFLNRMQCLYDMQWYATLAEECETFLKSKSDLQVTYYLAISLYHQCLNAAKDSEALIQLAKRAKPHFETLSNSELAGDVAQGYAHLCCILKDFPKATQIYQGLAKQNPQLEEEMLFQIALLQAEYNKEEAIQNFAKIHARGEKKSKEALYNQMILLFELNRFDELSQISFNDLPEDRIGLAHLYLGRSLLQQKKYEKAISEFKIYLLDATPSETLRVALISLLDASYNHNDLQSLDYAIAKLLDLFPQDIELPKAYFSRAQVLKKMQNVSEAQTQLEQLLAKFPQFQQKPQVLFELIHLDYQSAQWENCNKRARQLLDEFSSHQLASFAWRYLISSSIELASHQTTFKSQLIADLEASIEKSSLEADKQDWQMTLAKTYFELKQYEKALAILQNIKTPNAQLLTALCYRDTNPKQFCELTEIALSQGANLIEEGALHAALFNAYLDQSLPDPASEHLYRAFEKKAELKEENLLWLADRYYTRLLEEPTNFGLAHRTAQLLEHIQCKANPKNDAFSGTPNEQCKAAIQNPTDEASLGAPDFKGKAALHYEEFVCKLAKVYTILGRVDDQLALLEKLEKPGSEAQLLLAETYQRKGFVKQACILFDSIVESSASLRSAVSASACLQGVRLHLAQDNRDVIKSATQLKNLALQKTLVNEPLHLEAALDYVNLLAKTNLEKKLTLLKKTKSDFESNEDLLSKDYQMARTKYPNKDKIYQGYMQLIEAEILALQAKLEMQNKEDLNKKSKELLQKLLEESTSLALLERARVLLTNFE